MNAFRIFVVAVIALAVGLVGYQIGLSQAVVTAVPAGAAPVAYYGYPWHYGFGFGFFGLLFPLLFLFLIFGLVRAAFWGGRGWRGGGYGPGHGWGDPRSRLDEWHKEAHGEKPVSGGPSSPTST